MPAPLPNPHFVFPARDPDMADSQPETSESRTPPALPAFSFNPGFNQTLQPTLAHNPRAGGHRRQHSEFVGGDQLVTPPGDDKREEPSSPTQPSAPSGPPPGRGPGRRGHAHRRSAAVSGVDINAINKALGSNLTPGSAPCTPGDRHFDNGHEDISRPMSYSAGSLGRPTPPASPQFAPVPPVPPVPPIPAAIQVQPPPNNDDEDIGRPVSAISAVSNENSPNHHAVRFEQPENPPPVQLRPTQNHSSKPRPKTADASLAFDLIQSQNVPDAPSVKRSKSTGHSRSRKSMSTGNLEAMLAYNGTDDANSTDNSRASYSDDDSDLSDSEHEGDGTSPKKLRKSKKKAKKRVRSWAGAILTRGKGKKHPKTEVDEKKRPPALTPPMLTRTNSEIGSVLDVDFDNDDVVVLRTPTNPEGTFATAESVREEPPSPGPASAPSLETAWKPRSFYEQTAQDDTLSSPIIDLDAALGPFNTPDMRPNAGAPSKFSLATQRMYSGGRRGEFVGPEMRYHRRTESAPVMQPFDRSSLGPFRLGGMTAEAPDVFYEEEEDAFLAASQSPRGRMTPIQSGRAIPAQSGRATTAEVIRAPAVPEEDTLSVTSDDTTSTVGTVGTAKTAKSADTMTRAPEASSPMSSPEQAGLGIRAIDKVADQPETLSVEQHLSHPMHDTRNPFGAPPRRPIEILKSEERIPRPRIPHSPDVSPGFLAVDKRPATSPNELPPSIPPFSLSAGVSPSDSSFPSPDASQSFNDRNFSSHSYHHLPSEYPYASVEDVPSLTSSASTMTNTMPRFSSSFFPRTRLSTDRAASFSATVHRRSSQANSSKRSSLASLSKLVGGPNSERSKLHQEEKPPGDVPDHSKKKGRRLSRLMHFWKVRDKEKPINEAMSSE